MRGYDADLGGAQSTVSGSAAGASAQGASSQLEKCDESLGTLAVVEDQGAAWYGHLSQYKLGSTVPALRMMVQQSNCFVVVERGRAMQNIMQERVLECLSGFAVIASLEDVGVDQGALRLGRALLFTLWRRFSTWQCFSTPPCSQIQRSPPAHVKNPLSIVEISCRSLKASSI